MNECLNELFRFEDARDIVSPKSIMPETYVIEDKNLNDHQNTKLSNNGIYSKANIINNNDEYMHGTGQGRSMENHRIQGENDDANDQLASKISIHSISMPTDDEIKNGDEEHSTVTTVKAKSFEPNISHLPGKSMPNAFLNLENTISSEEEKESHVLKPKVPIMESVLFTPKHHHNHSFTEPHITNTSKMPQASGERINASGISIITTSNIAKNNSTHYSSKTNVITPVYDNGMRNTNILLSLCKKSNSFKKSPDDEEKENYAVMSSNHNHSLVQKKTVDSNMSFPETLHQMVTFAAEKDPSIIEWIEDGEAFIVHHENKELESVLQQFFKHKKYSSLQRQLNMYGFKKSIKGRFKGAFHHPKFHRDDGSPSALSMISRRPPPKKCDSVGKSKRRVYGRSERKIKKQRCISPSSSTMTYTEPITHSSRDSYRAVEAENTSWTPLIDDLVMSSENQDRVREPQDHWKSRQIELGYVRGTKKGIVEYTSFKPENVFSDNLAGGNDGKNNVQDDEMDVLSSCPSTPKLKSSKEGVQINENGHFEICPSTSKMSLFEVSPVSQTYYNKKLHGLFSPPDFSEDDILFDHVTENEMLAKLYAT